MPLYEYQCKSCNHELETIQKFSDSPLVDCPECETPNLKRKLSTTAFHLKGGGWYKDGYSDSKGGKEEKKASDTKKSGDEGGKGEGKEAVKDSAKDSATKETKSEKKESSSSKEKKVS